jgi:UDP-glucose 4-epimerase
MRVVITGVAGLLGSRLAAWLIEHVSDVEILGIDDLSCGYVENVPVQVPLTIATLGQRSPGLAEQVLRDSGPEYIFQFAA